MPDDARKRREMEAALRQIKTIQRRQQKGGRKRWHLDVPLSTLALQGVGTFIIGVLVGLGLFVLYRLLLS